MSRFSSLAPHLFGAAHIPRAGADLPFNDARFDAAFRFGLALAPTRQSMSASQPPLFPSSGDSRQLPSLADLQWLKHVVKVARAAELTSLGHSQALNAVAGYWGHRSWGSLEAACKGTLETSQERTARLVPLATLALEQLKVELPESELLELAMLALGIPCAEFSFEGYFGKQVPVLRIYCNGAAHVHNGDAHFATVYGYELKELHLQALDYQFSKLPQVSTVDALRRLKSTEQQALVRAALWSFAPSVDNAQFVKASKQDLAQALEEGLPLDHYVVLTHRGNADVHPGLADVLLGLPAFYDGAIGVISLVLDGDSLFGYEPMGENEYIELSS